jgi:hypothetical protein
MQFSAKPFGYPFAKQKELQSHPQADPLLQHILFCPTALVPPDSFVLNRQIFSLHLPREKSFDTLI